MVALTLYSRVSFLLEEQQGSAGVFFKREVNVLFIVDVFTCAILKPGGRLEELQDSAKFSVKMLVARAVESDVDSVDGALVGGLSRVGQGFQQGALVRSYQALSL